MKQSIWKYTLGGKAIEEIEMPQGAQILCVQTQREDVCLWAVVDESAPMQKRIIEVFGTGHPMPRTESRVYIGTFQMNAGSLVFHVFEKLI